MKIQVTYKYAEHTDEEAFYEELYSYEDFFKSYKDLLDAEDYFNIKKYKSFNIQILKDFETPENKQEEIFESGFGWNFISDAGCIRIQNSNGIFKFRNGTGGDGRFRFEIREKMNYKNFKLIASSVPVTLISSYDCKDHWIEDSEELSGIDTLFDFWAKQEDDKDYAVVVAVRV